MLVDPLGRKITYLRISVTDRCNLRCVYCMPPAGITWQPHKAIMRFEEILEVVKACASEGITEIRLTGGEPLVRQDLVQFVRMLSVVPGIQDISLTTNGLLLDRLAAPLVDAGLKRVNVSLDTLQPEKYSRITRGGSFDKAWKGLEAADQAGLAPLKINAVALKGINDGEILALARLSLEHPWHVRFIELMPIRNQLPWGEGFPAPEECYLSVREIQDLLQPLGAQPVSRESIGSGPAQQYRVPGAPGEIGIISALGEKFCESCNRLRLTADGFLRPCLMNDGEVNVLGAIRRGEPVLPLLYQAVRNKPRGYDLFNAHPGNRCMTQIGG
ncbi:MAG TPA: GTP 3',8-cyclase MoaA [Anaerolineaceae bacterium]|nr:GTP 3',8-cyclase MoaA [Anaerolineaceae bacterium]